MDFHDEDDNMRSRRSNYNEIIDWCKPIIIENRKELKADDTHL